MSRQETERPKPPQKRKKGETPKLPYRHRYLLIAVGIFGLSRIGYWLNGIRFDSSPLTWFWQYLDPQLLKTELGPSIWYLHSQPPLMNLYLGLVLKLFPDSETPVFALTYLLLGLVLTVALFYLLSSLNLPPLLATVLTGTFIASPAAVLYENWLFYTYPVAVLLVLAALCWVRLVRQPAQSIAFLFSLCLVLAGLLWSMFHLIWVLCCSGALLLLRRRSWNRVLLGLALPLMLITGWYLKNGLVFGQVTASSWFGMNFAKITNGMLRFEERKELHRQGTISAISLIPPFSELEQYQPLMKMPPPTGIKVLDQVRKSTGSTNYNHLAYIRISRIYARDAVRILVKKPVALFRGILEATLLFFTPSDRYLLLESNRRHISAFARLYNLLVMGQPNTRLDTRLRRLNPVAYYLQALSNCGFVIILLYCYALISLIILLKNRHPAGTQLLFCGLTILYAFLVGNLTEVGENNRFRFVLDPLILPFAGLLIQQITARIRQRPRASRR